MKAKVSLVGAGPGSQDLITVRGLRVLESADVVLYDALTNEVLMEVVPKHIPKVYVGKRCAKHSLSQDEINQLIVKSAFQYGHVVRLKGGDPFVFGRASEEMEYIESFGLTVDVVPGITSAISVPSSQGIPVTKRGISSSFWVLTATTRDYDFSKDLDLAARSSATLVILMGIRKLKGISHRIGIHRNKMTPLAVIQNGTLPSETCITGTLNDVDTMFDSIVISEPGIIIVGDVVAEHPSFFDEAIQRVMNLGI
jgi:uroporphyrin-III C-methyltransferase